MHTGMLWFDNSPAVLAVKIQKAIDYYFKKYGCSPDMCLVHPSILPNDPAEKIDLNCMQEKNKIVVRPYRPVLPGHIWIGIEDKE